MRAGRGAPRPARRFVLRDQKVNAPGLCADVAVHVTVMPNTTTFNDCPVSLSPEATLPVRGPVEMGWPAAMAGLELSVNDLVPPSLALFAMVRVEVTEFAASAIGLVIAEVVTVKVAVAPLWPAVMVADSEPNVPQLNDCVALVGVTASA